jgi:hypothetical protein
MAIIHQLPDIEKYGRQVDMYKHQEDTCIEKGTGEDKILMGAKRLRNQLVSKPFLLL